MPRLARNVFPKLPHHITQRGNRREDVFYTDTDKNLYLKWLNEYCQKYNVDILAYCLMTNHVHLVLQPDLADGLQKVLKPLHMRYAQYINKSKGWKGHLWQGRFFSSALDESYLWSAIRYIEQNPVRAGMVEVAEDYVWSSAAAHCGIRKDSLLTELTGMKRAVPLHEWSKWLSRPEKEGDINIIRRNVEKGLPCGSEYFIDHLETQTNRQLRYRPQGRPKKGSVPFKKVNIIGCGSIGRGLLHLLVTRNLVKAEHIMVLVKTKESQKQCLAFGASSNCFDLDNDNEQWPDALSIAQSIVYYFVPPPPQGTEDSRVRHFIKLLGEQRPARVVLISTTGVYGNCYGQWVNEDMPVNPEVDRARRRADAEQQFQAYCQQFNISLVILRVAGIYGSGKLPVKRIKAKTPIVRAEDSPYSNRIHADDLLEICIKAGLSESIEGIFNCADGQPTTMYDYFIKVARANSLEEPPAITLEQAKTQLSAGMLSYMNESRRIDNQKLLSVFEYSLKYPDLDKGLAAT